MDIAHGEDSRDLLERCNRFTLYTVAEKLGIQHPPDCPKYIWGDSGQVTGGMVQLLRSHGIGDAEVAEVLQMERVTTKDTHGRTVEQIYPHVQPHATARRDIDYEAEIARQIQEKEAREEEHKALMAGVLEENNELKGMVRELLEKLKETTEAPKKPKRKAKALGEYHALYRRAKEAGLPVNRKMKKAELEALLNGDATQRSQ